MEVIHTSRLRLRMATKDDALFIQDLYSSEDFKRFVGDKQLHTKQDAERYIEENILTMYRNHGVCLLVVERLSDSTPVGVCGLIKRDQFDSYDIGYGFLPTCYGCGFGLESSLAIIEYAKQNPQIDELIAITTSDNIASQKLLSRLGFTYVKVESKLSDTIDLLLYRLPLINHETHP